MGRERTRETGDRIGRASRTELGREGLVRDGDRPMSRPRHFLMIDDRNDDVTCKDRSRRGYHRRGRDDASFVFSRNRDCSTAGLVNNYAREYQSDEENAEER